MHVGSAAKHSIPFVNTLAIQVPHMILCWLLVTVFSCTHAESIREANPQVNYLEATVTEIVPKENKVVCESVMCEGASCSIQEFSMQFDKLVVAVGASVNTFG